MAVPFHHFDAEAEVAAPRELAIELPLVPDLSRLWESVHGHARAVADFAQLASERAEPCVRDFPKNAGRAHEWNRRLAARALSDLDAVLSAGVAALRAIDAEGRDPTAAAVTLWQEFYRSRAALLDLVENRVDEAVARSRADDRGA